MSERVVCPTDEQWNKIEPLIPVRPPRPKGEPPRAGDRLRDRCRRRYIVERTFGRFGNYRRQVVGHDRQLCLYFAF